MENEKLMTAATPKRRRSRKSLESRIDETLRQIDSEIETKTDRHRLSALTEKLKVLELLLRRKDEAKNNLPQRSEPPQSEATPTTTPRVDYTTLVRDVEQKHNRGVR
jgi:hypothetical protein